MNSDERYRQNLELAEAFAEQMRTAHLRNSEDTSPPRRRPLIATAAQWMPWFGAQRYPRMAVWDNDVVRKSGNAENHGLVEWQLYGRYLDEWKISNVEVWANDRGFVANYEAGGIVKDCARARSFGMVGKRLLMHETDIMHINDNAEVTSWDVLLNPCEWDPFLQLMVGLNAYNFDFVKEYGVGVFNPPDPDKPATTVRSGPNVWIVDGIRQSKPDQPV